MGVLGLQYADIPPHHANQRLQAEAGRIALQIIRVVARSHTR